MESFPYNNLNLKEDISSNSSSKKEIVLIKRYDLSGKVYVYEKLRPKSAKPKDLLKTKS